MWIHQAGSVPAQLSEGCAGLSRHFTCGPRVVKSSRQQQPPGTLPHWAATQASRAGTAWPAEQGHHLSPPLAAGIHMPGHTAQL